MSLGAVARKDIRDAVRSRTIWLLFAIFVLLFLAIAYAAWRGGDDAEFVGFIELSTVVFLIVLPLVGLALGYKSIARERTTGSIVLALSLPHSRRELVLGKAIGRVTLLTSAVLVGMAISSVVILATFDTFPVGRLLLFAGLSILYGAAFLAIGIAISMGLSSGRRITAAAFGLYVVLVMFWSFITEVILFVVYRFDAGPPSVFSEAPAWASLLRLLSPSESYQRLVTALFDTDLVEFYTQPEAPWVVDAPVAFVLLLAWIVVPMGLGYLRFRSFDL